MAAPLVRYGLQFPPGTTDLDVELHCFNIGHPRAAGGLGKHNHFKKAVDILWNNPANNCPKRFIWNTWSKKAIHKLCYNRYVGLAGCSSSGKTDPSTLWALVNYIADPTHTLVIMMSTTIQGAKQRCWKTFREYWQSIPGLPGKEVWSHNRIRGVNYSGDGFSDSSGIVLWASEKSKEREALGKLIGIKAPTTQGPYGREGKLILLIDEATDCSEGIMHAALTNLENNTNFQMICLGNPNSRFDPFGKFCLPQDGWSSVSEADDEWRTSRGVCVRFDASQNPRIVEGDERCKWMPTQAQIEQAKRDYGEKSLFFYRMYKGFWAPQGSEDSIYSEADIVNGDALGKAIWGLKPPVPVAALDPSFSEGGDRCIAIFGLYGTDIDGTPILQITDLVPLKEDISDTTTPRSFQIATKFRDLCQERGVLPENAAYDSTGGGGPFGEIIATQWSSRLLKVNFGGPASQLPVSASDRTKSIDRYSNRMSELWFGGLSLIRNGHIRGITDELAKEMCSRTFDQSGIGGKLRVETKKLYKARTGKSPDLADSFFVLIELCRQRFRFRSGEQPADRGTGGGWSKFARQSSDALTTGSLA